jgi:hypothetical protein
MRRSALAQWGAIAFALGACSSETSGSGATGTMTSTTASATSGDATSAGGSGAAGATGGSGGDIGAGGTGGGGAGTGGAGGSGTGPITGCAPLAPASGPVTTVNASQAAMLPAIVAGAAANSTIALEDGTYAVTASVWITKPGIVLRSASGRRDAVIIDGSYVVNEIVDVNASNVTIADLTIERAVQHPIHVVGGDAADTTDVVIHDVHIVDGGQQFVKVNANAGHFVDRGTLECSLLEMTDAGRPHIEANFGGCYTGGIDVHEARGWTVRQNTIQGIYCTNGSLAEHAIHVWTGSRDTLVERNVIVNCARGIGFGLGQTANGGWRTYSDDPYPGMSDIGHYGGIIRNNFVFASVAQFDTGIGLEQSRGTKVYHNTVVQPASAFSSIDLRFANTDADVRNNLVRKITQRDGATGSPSNNLQTTSTSLFVDASKPDLHLAPGATDAIDKGAALAEAGADIDGAPHDKGPPDLGADEFGAP